jgi:ketosteroid isomerase-like protein
MKIHAASRLCLLTLNLFSCSAPEPAVNIGDARAALIAADRAFAAAAAEDGLDGWMRYFAPDAVRLTLGAEAVQGLPAVRAHDAGIFADSTRRLTWAPTEAGVFADGQHGFTTGRYALIGDAGAAPDTLAAGAYLSIWRRNEAGEWQVILDTGN